MSHDAILSADAPRESLVSPESRPALVVDDDPEARQVLRDFLRLRGLAVLEAQNGLEALLSVKQHRPGVVVLDLNMPRLGGLEALKRIRPFDPTIRVAVVTEDPDAAIHQQARALGATVVLIKPVDLAQLETALGLALVAPRASAPVPGTSSETPPQPCAPPIGVADDAVDGADVDDPEPPPGLEEDREVVLPDESRHGRGEGEPTRGLGWLVGAVRAFLGAGPAREGESDDESLLPPAPGDGDTSLGTTSVSGRLQEEVDERAPGQRAMSYYGILGLTTEPFSTSPDPAFFYESASHKAVLNRLQIAIKLKRGLSLVLGDVGMGKTTLSRRLFQLLKREEKVSSHLILNPVYETEAEFLAALVKLFGIAPASGPLPVVRSLEILEGYLFEKGVEDDRTIVLLIDEAQRLSSSLLELLRALLNYETNEYKLLQLVLMGQMELLPRIREMKNLWDRISLKCVIDPLDEADTEAMIAFRLRKAGYVARRNLFTPDAIREIYRHTQGSPRRITTLCHDALERLVISDRDEVDAAIIRGLTKRVLA